MRIESASITWYRADHDKPIRNGSFTFIGTNKVVCKLRMSNGIEGFGWINADHKVLPIISDMIGRIRGHDALAIDRLWHKMYDIKAYGRRGLTTRALSAIDIALWDALGKHAGLPLYRLLGGYAEAVPAYIAGGYYADGKTIDDLAEEAQAAVSLGARAFKMKIGGATIKEDIERVSAVRSAVGEDIEVMVDANGGYTRIEALRVGRELEALDIAWFEEPVNADDLDGARQLRAKIDVPVAQGENEYTRHGFQELLRRNAADVLNPDAQILGGITEWKRCSDLALASFVPVAPHGDQDIHVHLAAAVPNGMIVEYYGATNRLREAMFAEPLVLEADGSVRPPDRPGLGVDITEDALATFVAGQTEV